MCEAGFLILHCCCCIIKRIVGATIQSEQSHFIQYRNDTLQHTVFPRFSSVIHSGSTSIQHPVTIQIPQPPARFEPIRQPSTLATESYGHCIEYKHIHINEIISLNQIFSHKYSVLIKYGLEKYLSFITYPVFINVKSHPSIYKEIQN